MTWNGNESLLSSASRGGSFFHVLHLTQLSQLIGVGIIISHFTLEGERFKEVK